MENNGKGIFYGVIGVATLIVAIIGATFAFFSASAENATVIEGTAAVAGLTLDVTEVTTGTGVMVPQLSTAIQTAVTGSGEGKSCIDGNGNTVCKVYKITVTNTGSSATVLFGTLALTATDGSTMTNLMWGKGTDGKTGYGATFSHTEQDLVDPATSGNNSVTLQPAGSDTGASVDYYVVVFINETKDNQNTSDKGSFKGTVSFNSATGSGVTSTFTA